MAKWPKIVSSQFHLLPLHNSSYDVKANWLSEHIITSQDKLLGCVARPPPADDFYATQRTYDISCARIHTFRRVKNKRTSCEIFIFLLLYNILMLGRLDRPKKIYINWTNASHQRFLKNHPLGGCRREMQKLKRDRLNLI